MSSDSNVDKIQASNNDIIFRGASGTEKARIKNTNAIVDGAFTGDGGNAYVLWVLVQLVILFLTTHGEHQITYIIVGFYHMQAHIN